ncbi:hypothetical protein BDV96DRAFT_582818 [Lophiotrema nucula]|uniref:Zn(2)-C6 fungal-type domain-containing protein n=1 Tax=Lophiotrema nucula TaxID=690887 RepID=A0A6A5YWV5_9PLEO|nr:hypothetical protein BDV96DRAFT_582818 [Lophiotrema nucula]
MGFSGRPSMACEPCRKLRTKCDFAIPSCTQCVRKGRACTGYRNEQDMLFRNETPLVVRRATRRRTAARGTAGDEVAMSFPIDPQLLATQQPSRIAAIDDEATNHFFAHYNEKFFAPEVQRNGGFDYIQPVYQQDLATGGPVPDIVKAAGLAGLGNVSGSQELIDAARQKQNGVIRKLQHQLQNPRTISSDSTILTCILLGVFENIICDSPQSAQHMSYHLNGAAELAKLRGARQFNHDIGLGIYSRMRGFMLAHCLQTREPLPPFILNYIEDSEISRRDFEPGFYRLLARLCQVRAQHKQQGYVDAKLADEAQLLAVEFGAWAPDIADWERNERPLPAPEPSGHQSTEAYRYIWLATIWIFQLTARILASDIVIEWARSRVTHEPGSPSSAALGDAITAQIELCEELKDSTSFYLRSFRDTQSAMRTVGGYGLLWPLYVLSTASTSTAETMRWIATHSEQIAEGFGVRQGKMMANFMKMYI